MFEVPKNEDGERYVDVYKIEWHYYKQNIINILHEMCIAEVSDDTIVMSLAYMLLTNLTNISSIDEDTDVERLIEISFDIFKELDMED